MQQDLNMCFVTEHWTTNCAEKKWNLFFCIAVEVLLGLERVFPLLYSLSASADEKWAAVCRNHYVVILFSPLVHAQPVKSVKFICLAKIILLMEQSGYLWAAHAVFMVSINLELFINLWSWPLRLTSASSLCSQGADFCLAGTPGAVTSVRFPIQPDWMSRRAWNHHAFHL